MYAVRMNHPYTETRKAVSLRCIRRSLFTVYIPLPPHSTSRRAQHSKVTRAPHTQTRPERRSIHERIVANLSARGAPCSRIFHRKYLPCNKCTRFGRVHASANTLKRGAAQPVFISIFAWCTEKAAFSVHLLVLIYVRPSRT